MRIIFLFLILFSCLNSYALDLKKMRERKPPTAVTTKSQIDLKKPQAFYIGFDFYSKNILSTTSQSNGRKDYFSPFQYPLSLAYSYRFDETYRFLPQLDYTVFFKKGEDGGTQESDLLLHLPLVRSLDRTGFEWKLGVVFHQSKILGKGGSVTLNDGTGSNVFYLPAQSSIANSFKMEFGMLYEVGQILIQGGFIVESPFNTSKRNYSLLAGLGYKIGSF